MEHGLRVGDDRVERVGAQIEAMEAEARPTPQAGEVPFLDGAGVVGNEGVQADDLVPQGQEPLAQVRADEARRPGDDALHGAASYGVKKRKASFPFRSRFKT